MATYWHGARIDLDAYLARVRYDGGLAPTLDTLRGLHRAHATAIPFENLDILLGRSIETDVDSLQDKLVHRRRGGYCYEQNLLFAAVLDRLDYDVTGLAARVRMGGDTLRPASHALLRVLVDGAPWLADVGFGGEGLLEPVPLIDGTEARQGQWSYRLDRDAGVWVLRSLHPDGWFDLYSLTLDPQYPVDFVVKNHYTSTHPRSPFVARALVQRTGPATRHTLVGDQLTTTGPDGGTATRVVAAGETAGVLATVFGIQLTPAEAEILDAGARGTDRHRF